MTPSSNITESDHDQTLRAAVQYTVALCTHNHIARLKRTLEDLGNLRSPQAPWELLIIDNGCTDGTDDLLATTDWQKAGLPARIVREDKLGLSNARNRAIQEAHGDYILFIDDDETPDPAWLVNYECAIFKKKPDALGGRIEVIFEDGNRPPWLQDELLGFLGKLDHGSEPRQLTEYGTPIFGGNFGFRKGIFEHIGNFDADLGRRGSDNTGGEDTEIYRRMIDMNCDVRWIPDAVIYHRIQATKLKRYYFLNLHYRQGYMEGIRKRGDKSRIPKAYLVPQLWRAFHAVIEQWWRGGRDSTLRKEMNLAYFFGYTMGWVFG